MCIDLESCESCERVRRAINLPSARRRASGRIYASCPFHAERTPSLLFDPKDGRYYCFGCHAHGYLPPQTYPDVLPGQLPLPLLENA